MSGSAGMRGYLLQSLVALIESLSLSNTWNRISIEPDYTSEKVDIQWETENNKSVVQVKSSQNQINKSHAEAWAKELKESTEADNYKLLLLGPTSQGVIDLGTVDGVEIPTPRNLDITGLIEQTAHKLDIYLEQIGISKIPPFARELIVNALITKLESYSTNGTSISRNDFQKILADWILVTYPNSVSEAVEMQCDILCDSLVLACPSAPTHNNLAFIFPIIFLNGGVRTAIINWIAIKIISHGKTKLYTPVALIDLTKMLQGRRKLHAENTISHFSEFAISSKETKELNILFSQQENNSNYPFSTWEVGEHTFQIFVKYNNLDTPLLKKELQMNISNELLTNYNSGTSSVCTLTKIEI